MNEHTRIVTGEDGGYITVPSLPAYTLYETAKGSQPIPISAYAFENGELCRKTAAKLLLRRDDISVMVLDMVRKYDNKAGG